MTSASAPPSRGLAALCLASGCWAFNFGLGAPLASLWLRDAGCSDTLIGLNTGLYYLGIALAANLVPGMMRRWGRGALVLGMVASAGTVAFFPWAGGLLGYFVLRGLNGVAGAISLIPLESQVNQNAAPEHRGRDFGYYAFCVAVGVALGNLVGLQLYVDVPRLAFLLGGALPLVAAVMVVGWMPWHVPPAVESHSEVPLACTATFLSFGSAWSQGFIEGSMVALLPVYLLVIGWTEASASWLLSSAMIGVILFQVPVAWLADRLGRTRVLLSCYVVVVISLAALPFCSGALGLTLGLFGLASCSAAFYPLGLSLLGERVPVNGLARANAWYLAINCVGSLLGPTVAGVAMDLLDRRALFGVGLAVVLLVMVVWLVLPGAGLRRSDRTKAAIERAA